MSEITSIIKNICEEKGLSQEDVLDTIELALAAAYRKKFNNDKNQNIKAEFNLETSKTKIFDIKNVVEDQIEKNEEDERNSDDNEFIFNPKLHIELSEAKKIKKNYKIGDEIITPLEVPEDYGRMAAQTAKQVIIQKLREAERETIYQDFKSKEGEVVSGVIQRMERKGVLVDIGKAIGILFKENQIPGERYRTGSRIKVYIKEVVKGHRGAEIILSRTAPEILEKIFILEIPEISNGLVELKFIAREAGFRSKVAVLANSDSIDPVGSCVGQRGSRIQTIIQELGGEKVDIIIYDEDPKEFISNALSPAKVLDVELNQETKEAIVKVLSDQLSLAIGKNGQNVRLASRLTDWRIDILEVKEDREEILHAVSQENSDDDSLENEESENNIEENIEEKEDLEKEEGKNSDEKNGD